MYEGRINFKKKLLHLKHLCDNFVRKFVSQHGNDAILAMEFIYLICNVLMEYSICPDICFSLIRICIDLILIK